MTNCSGVSVTDKNRIEKLLGTQTQVILAIDGLQPQVGQEVLWVIRDCLSETILLARSLLSSRGEDLSQMLCEVVEALPQSIVAVVSDAQPAIRKAVARALPNKPHQLCHYHYYKEAFKPITEADRHAKKELKKLVRGVRPIERSVSEEQEPIGEVVKGYCLAVRSALTDEGSYAKQLVFSKRDRYPGRLRPHVAPEGKRKRTEQSVKKKVFSSQVRKNSLMSYLT